MRVPGNTPRHHSITFKTKILCIVTLVASIPTLCLLLVFSQQVHTLQERQIYSLGLSFDQQSHSLSQLMEETTTQAIRLASNDTISAFFNTQGANEGEYVLNYVTAISPLVAYVQASRSSEVKTIRFFTRNGSLFSNLVIQHIDSPSYFDELEQELEGPGIGVRYMTEGRTYFNQEYSSPGTLSVFCPVTTSKSCSTYLEYELSFDSFFQSLSLSTDFFDTTDYLLLHESGNVIFSSDANWQEQLESISQEAWFNASLINQRITLDGTAYLLNTCPIPSINCVLVSYSNLSAISGTVLQGLVPSATLILLSVLFSCFSAIASVNSLLRRTNSINCAISQIQQGNFDIHVPVYGNDFIDQISSNFNNMALQIRNLIKNNYENQLRIKDLQIRMLSQQISPHFLYNTLECLKMQAVLENQLDKAKALTSLGRLLRYYANYASDFSPFSAELSSIEDYVNIMNLIEGRRCQFDAEIPTHLLDVSIPRFVLQPIIENSILHGSRSYTAIIHVRLKVRQAGKQMIFQITDDGVGNPPEVVQSIQEKLRQGVAAENPRNSIGLYNINARLKLIYNNRCELSYRSLEGKGTTVRFTIPSDCDQPCEE